jgi:hypothetical protein
MKIGNNSFNVVVLQKIIQFLNKKYFIAKFYCFYFQFQMNIDAVSCVWDEIFGFYGESLREFIVLAQTRKDWSLLKFCHLIYADIYILHLPRIIHLPKLKQLDVEFTEFFESRDKNTHRIDLKLMLANCRFKTITISNAEKLDLSNLKCEVLHLLECDNVRIPLNIEMLTLTTDDSTRSDFWMSDLYKLYYLSICYDDKIGKKHLRLLQYYPELTHLLLNYCCKINDLGNLRFCLKLRTLMLSKRNGRFTNLNVCQQLKELNVDLQHISRTELLQLTNLKILYLRNWNTSQNLIGLTSLPKLKTIILVKPQDRFEDVLNGITIKYDEHELA